ncbi:hypothetical protein IMCC26134_11540 [Verrucomicrobia bacterium IMCC26134]|nr:hypothetical protein IMCC26134_11540 [Verrucomicrobia bacterium IMCC26134]
MSEAESSAPAGNNDVPAREPLSLLAARVLGCLLEKELSTPDVYPLSLNSLVNACNQKSNRAPVMEASAREVEAAIETLRSHRLASVVSEADARVTKYRHTVTTLYPILDTQYRAILAELLLRGPQTTAELRMRAERMAPLPDMEGTDTMLAALSDTASGSLVRKLPRQAGKKEARWSQLLTGEPDTEETSLGSAREPMKVYLTVPPEITNRLASLEAEVSTLREELKALRAELGA